MSEFLGRRPIRREGVLDQILKDGSVILFRGDGEEMLVLNPLAALIWDMSDGDATAAALVREVQGHFPEQATVEADVVACLRDLEARGFVTWREPVGA